MLLLVSVATQSQQSDSDNSFKSPAKNVAQSQPTRRRNAVIKIKFIFCFFQSYTIYMKIDVDSVAPSLELSQWRVVLLPDKTALHVLDAVVEGYISKILFSTLINIMFLLDKHCQ